MTNFTFASSYHVITATDKTEFAGGTCTWDQLIDFVQTGIRTPIWDKSSSAVFYSCLFENNNRNAKAYNKNIIALDFDVNPDLNTIQSLLSEYSYIGYITFSHTEAKPRYRFILPLEQTFDSATWNSLALSEYFASLGFIDDHLIDPSAFRYTQPALFPGINISHIEEEIKDFFNNIDYYLSLPGVIEPKLFVNTGKALDLSKVPQKKIITVTTEGLYSYQDSLSTYKLIDILKTKEILHSIPANPSAHNKYNRKTVCAALMSLQVSYNEFLDLDHVMMINGSNTDSIKVWKDASKFKGAHPAMIYELLTEEERVEAGIKRSVDTSIKLPNNTNILEVDLTQSLYDIKDELNVLQYKKSLVIARTGLGKSYWSTQLSKKQKVVIAVPFVSLAQNFKESYGAEIYDADHKKKADLSSNLIACTYDSLPDLTAKIEAENTVLFIDEYHNLISAASKDYRLKACEGVINVSDAYKNVVHISATYVENELFVYDKVFLVKGESNVQVKFNTIYCDSVIKSAAKLMKEAVDNKRSAITYLNNTSQESVFGSLIAAIKTTGITKIAEINSKTKHTEAYQQMAAGKFNGIDVAVCTSLFTEGMSLVDTSETVVINTIGSWSADQYTQLSARARNAKTIIVNQLVSKHKKKYPIRVANRSFYKEKISRMIQVHNDMLKLIPDAVDLDTGEIVESVDDEMYRDMLRSSFSNDVYDCINFDRIGYATFNKLAFENAMYSLKVKAQVSNTDVLISSIQSILSVTGNLNSWSFTELHNMIEFTSEELETFAKKKEELIQLAQTKRQTLITKLNLETNDDNDETIERIETRQETVDKDEYKFRNQIATLTKALDYKGNLTNMITFITKQKITQAKTKTIARCNLITKALQDTNHKYHKTLKTLHDDLIQKGQLSSIEKNDFIKARLSNWFIDMGIEPTPTKINQVLNALVTTVNKTIRNSNKPNDISRVTIITGTAQPIYIDPNDISRVTIITGTAQPIYIDPNDTNYTGE